MFELLTRLKTNNIKQNKHNLKYYRYKLNKNCSTCSNTCLYHLHHCTHITDDYLSELFCEKCSAHS